MVFEGGTIMQLTKYDLFGPIHKALRAALFQTAGEAARADLRDDAQLGALAASVRRLVGFLDEHAAHEDAIVLPFVAAHAPDLAATLGGAHEDMERMQKDAVGLAAALADAVPAERRAAAAALATALHRLIATQLEHMDLEEGEAAEVLITRYSTEELGAMRARITQAIPPTRAMDLFKLMLPALNPTERAGLLASLEAALPPAAMLTLLSAADATREVRS
jgi:hypothetical protein